MKLKIFRIISLIGFAAVSLLGVLLAIYNIVLNSQGTRIEENYIILLIALLIGSFFSGFEVYFIIKSFKEGTLLLHQLCIKEKHHEKKRVTLIIAIIVALLVLSAFIFNLLIYNKTLNINQGPMTSEFNMYYCILILVNSLELILYYLFIVEHDIEVQN